MANVAGLRGDWDVVVNAVKIVFGGKDFILLAEDGEATKPPHFEWGSDLKARYPRGRAFDNEREVRWRETSKGRFVVTYLSEQTPSPQNLGFEDGNQTASAWKTRPASQKLYGKLSRALNGGGQSETGHERDWIEVAVPGVSRNYYRPLLKTFLPKSDTDPMPLEVATVDYIRGGLVQMTRYCRVRPYPE